MKVSSWDVTVTKTGPAIKEQPERERETDNKEVNTHTNKTISLSDKGQFPKDISAVNKIRHYDRV